MLAVELANEPHTSDNYERKAGLQPGSLIKAWSCEMAQFIKSIDPNHMVTCSSMPLTMRSLHCCLYAD